MNAYVAGTAVAASVGVVLVVIGIIIVGCKRKKKGVMIFMKIVTKLIIID